MEPRHLEFRTFEIHKEIKGYQISIHPYYTYVTDAVHGSHNTFPGWSRNLYFDNWEDAVKLGEQIEPLILEAARLRSQASSLSNQVTTILNDAERNQK